MKPKVLLLEPIHAKGMELLAREAEILAPQSLSEEGLIASAGEAEAIIARAIGRISRRVIESAPRLRVIGRHGVGVDNIDVQAATERKIWVVFTPEANAQSVAEHFILLALGVSRRVVTAAAAVQKGDWHQRIAYVGRELFGKTVGIIGFGRVGQAIGRLCHHGFACPTLYFDVMEYPDAAARCGARRTSLDELLRASDFVSINLPLTPQTERCIGKAQIRLMQRSAYLINLARGRIWDEGAVYEALRDGVIAGAASDVFETEPPDTNHPLLTLENFLGTPHYAAHTEEALLRMTVVVEDILAVLRGQRPRYPFNDVAG